MNQITLLDFIKIASGIDLDECAKIYSMCAGVDTILRNGMETDIDFRNRLLDHYSKTFSEIKLTTSQCPDNIKL